MLNAFRGSQNYKKTMWKKLKALHRIWIAIALPKISNFFLLSMFKFVTIAAAYRPDAPSSKKYVIEHPKFWWGHSAIFGLEKYK